MYDTNKLRQIKMHVYNANKTRHDKNAHMHDAST